ncbi:hypothetical protein K431DRAFT_166979 [Polychaeton citri CBS 116435]|uniref:Heterokaryon incompatibility domain-containing protein n=1 Tax=Polychaeton citri CBS 116435 TaxID=1314669 RepID=A0A9P4QFX3_9PEZI|nr:hypothetical protein K431DRAFT_166979 [Polychaeton citri CBS 116435]
MMFQSGLGTPSWLANFADGFRLGRNLFYLAKYTVQNRDHWLTEWSTDASVEEDDLGWPVYAPLPHPRCTRIFSIRSVDTLADVKIVCKFRVINLEADNIPYTALSYTWGEPEVVGDYALKDDRPKEAKIKLIGEEGSVEYKYISRTLYIALRQVWKRIRHAYVWADQICIDQDDTSERSRQIELMGSIYSQAKGVLAWTGHDSTESPMFEELHTLATESLPAISQHILQHRNIPRAIRKGTLTSDVRFSTIDDGLGNEFSGRLAYAAVRFWSRRRYLSRAWIIQELVLAKNVEFMLENWGLNLHEMVILAAWLGPSSVVDEIMYSFPWRSTHTSGRGFELFQVFGIQIVVHGGGIKHQPFREMLSIVYGAHDSDTFEAACLEWLITLTQCRGCAEPRERLFSLLGMLSALMHKDVSQVLSTDYNTSVEELFQSYARRQLQILPHRTFLSLVCDPKERTLSHVPSWVPDFSRKAATATLLSSSLEFLSAVNSEVGGPLFDASNVQGDMSGSKTLVIEGSQLHLCGYKCGTVTSHSKHVDLCDADLQTTLPVAYSWLAWLFDACYVHGPTYTPGQDTIKAILWVILRGTPNEDQCDEIMQEFIDYITLSTTQALMSQANRPIGTQLLNSLNIMQTWNSPWLPRADDPMLVYAQSMLPVEDPTDTVRWLQCLNSAVTDFAIRTCLPPGFKPENPVRFRELIEMLLSPYCNVENFSQSDIENLEVLSKDTSLENFQKLTLRSQRCDKFRRRLITQPTAVLFTTENGHFGSCTQSTQKGDEIWIVNHARVPFLLRPLGGGCYTLINEAYLHGVMFGEFLTNGLAGEEQELVIV